VRITLPEDNERVHAARYQRYLPTEEELRLEVTRSREEVEQRLLLEVDGTSVTVSKRRKPHKKAVRPSSRSKGSARR